MIVCGWCGKPTANTDRCTSCGHAEPETPWRQRGEDTPKVASGRPGVDRADVRRQLAEARSALGPRATVEAIAEHLNVSPRTVRRWREMA